MREALAGYGAMLQLDPDAMLATATERTGLDDWGDPAFPGTPRRCCAPRCATRPACPTPGSPWSSNSWWATWSTDFGCEALINRASRDRGRPDRAADHHLRAAAHGHHPPAQPVGRRPGVALPAVLGEPRTVPVPGRARRAAPTGPVCDRTGYGEHLDAGVQTHARHDRRPRARGDSAAGQRHLRHAVRNHLPDTEFRRALQELTTRRRRMPT